MRSKAWSFWRETQAREVNYPRREARDWTIESIESCNLVSDLELSGQKAPLAIAVPVKEVARLMPTVIGRNVALGVQVEGRLAIYSQLGNYCHQKTRVREHNLKDFHYPRTAFPGVPRLALKSRHFENMDDWGGLFVKW